MQPQPKHPVAPPALHATNLDNTSAAVLLQKGCGAVATSKRHPACGNCTTQTMAVSSIRGHAPKSVTCHTCSTWTDMGFGFNTLLQSLSRVAAA